MPVDSVNNKAGFRLAAITLAATLLGGCATTENALKDADELLAKQEASKKLPEANLSEYALSLNRFGQMLDIYKDGDPVIYMQTRNITDATNLSNPLVGSEIPGDITEMVRTAVNRIGARIVYVPYHPDYLIAQAQLGAKFGVTMPDYLITGALTEFDRALSGAGRSNSATIEFGGGKGTVTLGGDLKRTAIYSSLALDLNLVSFQTQQMVLDGGVDLLDRTLDLVVRELFNARYALGPGARKAFHLGGKRAERHGLGGNRFRGILGKVLVPVHGDQREIVAGRAGLFLGNVHDPRHRLHQVGAG